MIILGTTGLTFTREKGQFHCPSCGDGVDYRHKKVRCFFTLYFVPLIPLHSLGEYVECQRCQGTYHLDILSYDPVAQAPIKIAKDPGAPTPEEVAAHDPTCLPYRLLCPVCGEASGEEDGHYC